ncbi:hypothetical protein B0T25DRAFT_250662 [Lasiosphaeria hispida]|uniref:Uncharacterized protein n=1 Tax=Lasiosphaeria hispida TaxID=260671 RepID=A0AAJ0HFG7_9PEZI|nr:hypothetical protein B0T25DRAFT_250662 [Lasiosphaeria hispida]
MEDAIAESRSPFPLQGGDPDYPALCQVLWDWKLCDGSHDERRADDCVCRWKDMVATGRLLLFLHTFYQDITGAYVPDFFGHEDQALRTHKDLRDIILLLRQNGAALSRDDCMETYFLSRAADQECMSVPRSDQLRAFTLAARIMTMTSISCDDESDTDFLMGSGDERGQRLLPPVSWLPDKSLLTAVSDAFPTQIHPSLQDGDTYAGVIRSNLTAVNLMRVAGLKIEATANLHDHLKLNQANGTVQVFHGVRFLRENLLSTRQAVWTSKQFRPTGPETNLSPCLPRLLALETLYTHQLLFPQEEKSQALLRNLVSKHGFDRDCLTFGIAPFEQPVPVGEEKKQAQRFLVWGSRLMDLYDEIENPKPRSTFDTWIERRSKSRHVMLATVAGVMTAVVLGLLSLCVSIFQAWIAWQDWEGRRRG